MAKKKQKHPNKTSFKTDIDDVIKMLKEELPEDIKKVIQKTVVERFPKELQATHEKEQDPYGKPWKDTKTFQDHSILDDTGKLKRAYKAIPKPAGASLTNTRAYASYHNEGASRMPQRLLLPTRSKGLPDNWQKILQDAVNRLLKEKFKQ